MVTAAIAAGCTLLALAPLRRPFALGVLSFLLTLALNEVPFLGFYYLLASTLLALSQGGIDAPGSRAAAGLAVLTTAGLAVIAWLGMHNYTYLSLRSGGHFSVKEVAKSFADIFVWGIATRG